MVTFRSTTFEKENVSDWIIYSGVLIICDTMRTSFQHMI